MTRDWKPGDVADVVGTDRTYRGIYVDGNCLLGCAIRNAPHWHAVGGSMRAEMYEARPLAVIDPEDREQVERLGKALFDHGFIATTRLAAALRSLIAPPKPPEPTGREVRVIDREGDAWALVGDKWVCEHGGVPRAWSYLVGECGPLEVRP